MLRVQSCSAIGGCRECQRNFFRRPRGRRDLARLLVAAEPTVSCVRRPQPQPQQPTSFRYYYRRSGQSDAAEVTRQPILQDLSDTPIVCVWNNGKLSMMGDDMITKGHLVAQQILRILSSRTQPDHKENTGPIIGFAGTALASLTLLKRFEEQLENYGGRIDHASVELAKKWGSDPKLRQLNVALIVAHENVSLEVNSNDHVIETYDGVLGVGRGPYAVGTKWTSDLCAADKSRLWRYLNAHPHLSFELCNRLLVFWLHFIFGRLFWNAVFYKFFIAVAKVMLDSPELGPVDVARKSMDVAADLCTYPFGEYRFEYLDTNVGGERPKDEENNSMSDSEEKTYREVMKEQQKQLDEMRQIQEGKRKKGLAEAIKNSIAEAVKDQDEGEKNRVKNIKEVLKEVGLMVLGAAAVTSWFFWK